MTAAPRTRTADLRAQLAATTRLVALAARADVTRHDVLDALLAETAALVGADAAALVLCEGGAFRLASRRELPAAMLSITAGSTITADRPGSPAPGSPGDRMNLTKPVDRDRLLAAVARHRGGADANPPGHVLVVDDDPTDRLLICRALAEGGVATAEAADGHSALAELDARRPAVIVLDLVLPGMDGFEVLAELRRRGGPHPVPVVVLTAMDLTAADRRRLGGGVECVLTKNDLAREQLVSRVRELVAGSTKAHGSTPGTSAQKGFS